jgi:hypothetical protein
MKKTYLSLFTALFLSTVAVAQEAAMEKKATSGNPIFEG